MSIDDLLRDGEEKLREKGMAITAVGPDAGNSPRLTRAYLDSLLLEMRVIDAVRASTEMNLFGQTFATPVMVAALSSLDRIRPNGTAETAKGAAAAGAAMWAGIGDDDELKAMVDTGAKTVKIVKPYLDHDLIYRKIEAAEKIGAFALGMDVDFVFGRKNGAAPVPMGPKTLADLAGFIRATKLPFILKGVLGVTDAKKAVAAGAAGIVVSHHGGAVMDYALPPLRVLPHIVKAVGGELAVFVDCGIARGMDAFKALALGAKAVSVGKAVMAGLAADGAEGVRRILEDMTLELQHTMSLTGARDLNSIDPDVLWGPA